MRMSNLPCWIPVRYGSAVAVQHIRLKRTQPLRAGDVVLYRLCEDVTEALIYFMMVFGPWAFGTTQPWSIWTMNIAGLSLGALLIVKLAIRHMKGFCPARWGEARKMEDSRSEIEVRRSEDLANSDRPSPIAP